MALTIQNICRLWKKSIDFVRNFNVFPSVPPSTDEHELHIQRISTRLFIFSFVISLAILIGYTSLVDVVTVREVNAPDLTQYRHLYSKYAQTLTCPCTEISIRYGKFLRINYTLHQVCHSDFVSDNWLAYLSPSIPKNDEDYEYSYTADFRTTGIYIFQALKMLCSSSDRTISDSLSRFDLNEYATLTVAPEQLFRSQSQFLMNAFISSTLATFLSSLQTIRDTTQSNNLFSALQTNHFLLFVQGDNEAFVSFATYFNCSCQFSAQCIGSSVIMSNDGSYIEFFVPGVYMGCFALEASLQSTLECFYDQACIDTLQSYITDSSPMNISALDSSLITSYQTNSTIQELVNQLMVEKWNLSSVYENYYEECQPMKCSYTSVSKNSAIYIVTAVLGFISGLVKVLYPVIPRLVKFTVKLAKLIKRRLVSQTTDTGRINVRIPINI